MTFRIGDVEIGGQNPCRFVAEISNNHNGDFRRAIRLIDAAKVAGAGLVKFQAFRPSELVALRGDGLAPEPWGSAGWTMQALYERAQTPLEWFPDLVAHCIAIGMPWFSSCFGEESADLLHSLNCPAYKVARLDNANPILEAALTRGLKMRPLIVSQSKPSAAGGLGRHNSAAILYCPEGYPQQRFDFDREEMFVGRYWHGDWCEPDYVGFSYHGTSIEPPIVAATLGAKIIEAHFQLDEERSELENNVSLRASDFRLMVDRIQRVEEMLA